MSETSWTATPGAIDDDVAVVVAVADEQERKAWRIAEHLDDRTRDQLLALAKAVI